MLRVGGLTPLSSTDWPGRLAAVVFCQGCPWRCGYCHNPDLIPAQAGSEIAWDEVMALLRRRQGLLDAVVFSGGEPTLQAALPDAMREVRALGFKVGLHTGGMYPRRLEAALPWVDWVGLDVKAPFDAYAGVTGVDGSGARALESLQQVLASGVDYEVRTTVHPELLDDLTLAALARDLAARGVRRYVVQAFRPQGCEDARLHATATRTRSLQESSADFAGLFDTFSVRA